MSFDYNGIFSYDDAKDRYKKQDIFCNENNNNKECIEGSFCGYYNSTIGKCAFHGYCLEDDMKKCAVQKDLLKQCKNDNDCRFEYKEKDIECLVNEDCLSNKCSNSTCIGRTYIIMIGEGEADYGLDDGEKCTKNSQCIFGDCREGGVCGPPYMFYIPDEFFYGLFIVIALSILCCIKCCCCKRKKNSQYK